MENVAHQGRTLETLRYELTMGNIVALKEELLESSVGYIPYAWAVGMKHVIPQVLLVLFFNLAFSKTDHGRWEFGNYGDYSTWPFQVLGVSCVVLEHAIVCAGLARASLFKGFVKTIKKVVLKKIRGWRIPKWRQTTLTCRPSKGWKRTSSRSQLLCLRRRSVLRLCCIE
jgi:hypothetical protein